MSKQATKIIFEKNIFIYLSVQIDIDTKRLEPFIAK